MEKFIWTDKYSIGIREIDEQHQHFFGIANGIIDLTEKENIAKEEIFKALEELGNYAFYHFGTEESYFDKFNYPDAPLHIDAHNKYRETINKYLEDIRKGGIDVKKMAQETASYSSEWLSRHILVVDIQYTKFFKEHGVI